MEPVVPRAQRGALSVARVDQFCECGKKLAHNPRRKGNQCQKCATLTAVRLPEYRERQAAAARAMHADPTTKAKRREGLLIAWQSDERRQRASDTVKRRFKDPNARRQHGRAMTEARLGDIPLEFRDEYRALCKQYHLSAADARRIIRDQIDRDLARYSETGKLQKTTGG